MNQELFDQATYPKVMTLSGPQLLRRLTEASREQALSVLAAAVTRAEAAELADALEADPLRKAREAAAAPLAAVEAAREARDREDGSISARLRDYFTRKADDAATGEREPDRDTPRMQELRAALAAAEEEAMPFKQRVAYHEDQINALRNVPAPDPAILAVLAEALCGCHVDTPTSAA